MAGKKGQQGLMPVIYVFLAIVVVLLASWGFYQYFRAKSSVNQADFIIFSNSLNKLLVTDSSELGNVKQVSLALPEGTDQVCMVDRSGKFDELSNAELSVAANKYSDANVFLRNNGDYVPLKVDNLKLDNGKNPYCIIPSGGKIGLNFENRGTYQSISSPNPESMDECTVLSYSGNPSGKLDFAFVAANYKSLRDFRKDAEKYIAVLKGNDPFKADFGRLNFYLVDDLSSIQCTEDSLIRCDEFKVHEIASKCPNDMVILLYKNSNLISPPRSSSILNLVKISASPVEDNSVILHELGHAIGHLADEYVDNAYYQQVNFRPDDYPNCDYAACPKWENESAGCYGGCSMSSYYRPTQDSIMRSLSDMNYGPVDVKVMEKQLDAYS